MMPAAPESSPCPAKATLRRVLEAPADALEDEEVLAHLGGCASCQRQLDQLAGVSTITDDWKPALKGAPGAAAAPPDSETLSDLLDHLKRNPGQPAPSPVTAAELTFLQPSEQADSLGRLGNHEIVELVAQGGMGLVLRAIDPKLDRVVAIKVLSPALAAEKGSRERFLREARAAASLDHPNVLPVFSVGEENGFPYLVMPLVTGESLQQRITREGALPTADVVAIGAKIARGLAAAHEAGLVHRDVKPANILLDADGSRVWITDFGLARAAQGSAVSATGSIAGTPQYMAPEQFETADVDARADLFSFGGVLYAMATGKAPFRGDSAVTAMRSVREDNPVSPDRLNANVPAWLAAEILTLLEKSPDRRPASAVEVAEALERSGAADTRISASKAALIRMTLAAIVVAVVGAAMVWHFVGNGSNSNEPFRIEGGDAFASLADAVEAANHGDTIEIAGDIEVLLADTVSVEGKALRLRAAPGDAPVLTVTGDHAVITTDSRLILEGLTFKHLANTGAGCLLFSTNDLYLMNCRLGSSTPYKLGRRESEFETLRYALVKLGGGGEFEAINSEFYSPGAVAAFVSDVPEGRTRLVAHENCTAVLVDMIRIASSPGNIEWNARRSFFAGRSGVLAVTDGAPILFSANIDHCVMGFKGTVIGQSGMTRQAFRRSGSWQGDANLYANCPAFLRSRPSFRRRGFGPPIASLSEWIDFWGRRETRANYVNVRLRDGFSARELPRGIDDIDADTHFVLPPALAELAVDAQVGPDFQLLGQGGAFDRARGSDTYPVWLRKVTTTDHD